MVARAVMPMPNPNPNPTFAPDVSPPAAVFVAVAVLDGSLRCVAVGVLLFEALVLSGKDFQ